MNFTFGITGFGDEENTMSITTRETGTVQNWLTGRGFGFIAPDFGGRRVFVHATALPRGMAELPEGARVTYGTISDDKGPRAVKVELA